MRRALPVLIVLAALAGSQARATQPRPAAQEAEAEGYRARAVERFKAKDFQAAAKLFMQAYARSHAPALVYNAARAYEEAGMRGEAVGLFKLYLSLTDDAAGIVEARERLRRLEAAPAAQVEPKPAVSRSEAESAPSAQAVPSKPVPAAPAAPAPLPAAPSPVLAVGEPPAGVSAATPSPPAAWPRWTSTGAAGLGIASGVALLVLGQAGTQEANERLADNPIAYNEAFDKAQTQWRAGAALTAAGVGLAGLSAWLWLREPAGRPLVAPAAQGLAIAGRF